MEENPVIDLMPDAWNTIFDQWRSKMEYKLLENGDSFEKKFWPLLSQEFPNYEILWARFIVPLTKRATGEGINIKPDLDPKLESLAMTHYSTFYHLCIAADLQQSGFPYSEDILFHLSASSEMVDRFVLTLVKLDSAVLGNILSEPLTEEKVVELTRDYWQKKYIKQHQRFLNKGQSVHIPLHSVDDLSEEFFRGRGELAIKDYKEWYKVTIKVHHYRNTLAHNPLLGKLVTENGIVYVPKETELYKYELWSSVFNRSNNSDFIPLDSLLSSLRSQLVSSTNTLWVHAIEFLNDVSAEESYKDLLNQQVGGNKRITTLNLDEPNGQSETVTKGSGEFTNDLPNET